MIINWCNNFSKCISYIIIWVFVCDVNYCTTATSTADLGCQLEPSVSGGQTKQNEILDQLRHRNMYGKRFSYESKDTTFTYDVVVCGDVDAKIPNAAVTRTSKSQGGAISIGMRNRTTVTGSEGEWTMLQLKGGNNDTNSLFCKNTSLSSSIMLLCDRKLTNGKLKLLYKDEDYCNFAFELRTASMCNPPAGMSGWTVFFIIILVAFAAYFLLGFVYLRCMIGAKGVDQIPHRLFWFKVGNKLADCCALVCRCDQYCEASDDFHSPGSGGYSPIGEGASGSSYNIPQPSDKDSTLLNP